MKGLMIAADRSGSGKTTLTRALIYALMEKGMDVIPFKCGPDYIDPMYHSLISGKRGHNLDTFFTDHDRTKRLFAREMGSVRENSIAIVEGVMGLYDGLGGFSAEGSSYDLADALEMPIVLCVNARGAAQTLIALISGILSFDKSRLIRAIFLNQVSDGFYPVLKKRIEQAFGIPVIGHFPADQGIELASRHLGLLRPWDIDIRKDQARLSQISMDRIDINRLLSIGEMPDIKEPSFEPAGKRAVIAIARDRAFDFFYSENELVLSDKGAHIVYFSPLSDKKLPEGTAGIILPGGYPELYADQLKDNQEICGQIRDALRSGMPLLAECGGYMYLHESIGGSGPLVSVLDGDVHDCGKSLRFGYLTCSDRGHFFVKEGKEIRGHEFHYYDTKDNGDGAVVTKPGSGRVRRAGFCGSRSFMSFMHFYYPSYPDFAGHFLKEAASYAAGKGL